MTNKEIQKIAMQQSAIDLSCAAEDFVSEKNRVVRSHNSKFARKYLSLPFFCNLVSYGRNIVASVDNTVADFVEEYINQFQVVQCFETPNLLLLAEEFKKYGYSPCFMAEYFLPDMHKIHKIDCSFKLKILHPEDFAELYLPEWANALCEKRKQLDILAVGAYEDGKLIGLAGASADCGTMWQIGIDVLPAYRQRGLGAALTSMLALEIIKRGKVPFYCAAWSNIPSVRNAIKSGFRPAWIELTSVHQNKVNPIIGKNLEQV